MTTTCATSDATLGTRAPGRSSERRAPFPSSSPTCLRAFPCARTKRGTVLAAPASAPLDTDRRASCTPAVPAAGLGQGSDPSRLQSTDLGSAASSVTTRRDRAALTRKIGKCDTRVLVLGCHGQPTGTARARLSVSGMSKLVESEPFRATAGVPRHYWVLPCRSYP